MGPWRIFPALNRLRGLAGDLQLEPQTMRVLLTLLHHAGDVVTRRQLHDLAWDGAAISDESLSRAIFDLRKALGDRAADPEYIETIRTVGYRLIAPVRAVREENREEIRVEIREEKRPDPKDPGDSHPGVPVDFQSSIDSRSVARDEVQPFWVKGRFSNRPGRTGAILALGLAAGLILALALRPRDSQPSPPGAPGSEAPQSGAAVVPALVAPAKTVQLTSYPGYEFHPTVSSDASRLAFAWGRGGGKAGSGDEGNVDLYWRPIDDSSPIRLTRDPARDDNPAFSPDGQRVAFIRRAPNRCELRIAEISSGESERVAPCREAGISPPVWWRGSLIYADRDARDEPFRLHRLDLSSFEVTVVTSPPFGSFGDLYPALSESGDKLAFLRATAQSTISTYLTPAIGDLFSLELSAETGDGKGGEMGLRRLTFENQLIAGLSWVEGDSAVVFAAKREGQGYALWRVAATGVGTPRRLVDDPGGLLRLPVRAGPGRIAYERWDGRTDIFQVFFGAPAEQTIQASTRSDLNPRWHPGGDRIAFTSARTGKYEIWTSLADGSEAKQRTSLLEAPAESPSWSPEGRRLVFEARSGGHSHLYLIDEVGELRQLTASVFDDRAPSFSVDGQAVYFASNRSGSWQIWRLDLGAPKAPNMTRIRQITRGGGFRALEGLVDGEPALFFSKRDDGGLWRWRPEQGIRPTDSGARPGEEFIADLAAEHWGNWDLVDGTLYFVELTEDRTTRIHAMDLVSGQRRTAAVMAGLISRETPNLSISPDGRSALVTRFNGLAADILLVDAGDRGLP